MAVTLNQLMDFMVAQGASDLHIAVGRKPVIRKSGHLKDVNAPELTAADTIRLMKEIAPEKNIKELQEVGSTDWGHAFGEKAASAAPHSSRRTTSAWLCGRSRTVC